MGNSATKPPLPSELQSIKDSRYGGNLMINFDKTKVYQIFDIDQNNVDNFSNLLKQRKQLRHPNFISVSKTWVEDYRQHCSFQTMYRVTVQYLYLPLCLEDQIQKYYKLQVCMPEKLVRKYFAEVASCLDYLKNRKTCHGDVKPKNILIDTMGRAFLTDSYFMNGGKVSYEIVLEDPCCSSFLSPRQLESLRSKKFVSLQQVHEDEIFGLGLCMIEVMTAEPAMQCYDFANLKIKQQFFHRKYAQMTGNGYSNHLCRLVMSCVDMKPEKRINFTQFLQTVIVGLPHF